MTATKTRKPRRTPEERNAQREALMKRLDAFRDQLDEMDEDERLDAAIAHFEKHYSERNAQLIVMQNPDATDVKGFHGWHDVGRAVRKGEHGIQILAPAGSKEGEKPSEAHPDGTKGRQFFRIAYVFDYGQTQPIEQAA